MAFTRDPRQELNLQDRSEFDEFGQEKVIFGRSQNQQQQQQGRNVDQEMLSSLRRTLRTAVETDEISQRTAEVLESQDEQINSIKDNSEKIEQNLDTSEWLLRGLQSWTGRLVNAVVGPPVHKPTQQRPTQSFERPPNTSIDNRLPEQYKAAHQASMTTKTNTTSRSSQPIPSTVDEECDQHLDNIYGVLTGIKARSLEINKTIERQTDTVQQVNSTAERSYERLAKQRSDLNAYVQRR